MKPCDPWGDASRSRVDDRWATAAAGWNATLTDALIAAAAIAPESQVVDVAAGSGDPLARNRAARVGGESHRARQVVCRTRVCARAHGEKLGVASRSAFVQADVYAIPVASDCADRITCRFGVMFFEKTGRALSEMLRVLRPGGRVALPAWGRSSSHSSTPRSAPYFVLCPPLEHPSRLVPCTASPGAGH